MAGKGALPPPPFLPLHHVAIISNPWREMAVTIFASHRKEKKKTGN